MWWSRAFVLLILVGLGPVGCGFKPMYATSGPAGSGVDSDLGRIRIGQVTNRIGQQLRNQLVQQFSPRGEAADYEYTLDIELGESFSSLGYRKDTYATVGNMRLTAMVMMRRTDGTTIMSRSVDSTVYFDYVGPRYASIAMERDAEDRALSQLADEIRNHAAVAIQRYKANPNDEIYTKKTPFMDGQFGRFRSNAMPYRDSE